MPGQLMATVERACRRRLNRHPRLVLFTAPVLGLLLAEGFSAWVVPLGQHAGLMPGDPEAPLWQALAGAGVSVGLIILGTWLLSLATRALSPVARMQVRHDLPVRWVILPLSALRDTEPAERAALDAASAQGDATSLRAQLDRLTGQDRRLQNWQQPLRVLDKALRGGRLERVVLVGSPGGGGSAAQGALFTRMVEPLLTPLAGRTVHVELWPDQPDFEDFDALLAVFTRITAKAVEDDGLDETDIVIDITGGTKPVSVAALIATLNRDMIAAYANAAGEVKTYDAHLRNFGG